MGSDVRTVVAGADTAPTMLGTGEVGTGLYRVAPWVLVRTPLLPASSRDLAGEPRRALADPEVVRALAIGSPTLLADALRGEQTGKDAVRTDRGLARYLIRMSTRPTPYGAFAGVSLATWASSTKLRLGEGRRTRTRPDMAWLRGLLAQWERRPEVRAKLRWRSDPLMHDSGDRLVAPTGGSVRATEPARIALAEAATWLGHDELVSRVVAVTSGSVEQVEGLVEQLWTAGLLRNDLTPALTGAEATTGGDSLQLVSVLDDSLAEQMSSLMRSIGEADSGGAGQARESFGRIVSEATGLFDHAETFQTDLVRDLARDGLPAEVGLECARAAETLLRLGPGPAGAGDLATYTRRFAARWGQGREVPLAQVFDPVRGLGSLPHTHGASSVVDPTVQARRAERLMALALEALRDGRRVVELDPAMVTALSTWPRDASGRPLNPATASDAPLSLDLSAFVVAEDSAAVDRGDFTLVVGPNLGASLGGRWLGRFADLFDGVGERCYDWLNRAEREADPESVPAEVVYLPDTPRSTNVVIRPTVGPYEIVVSGRGSAEHTIDLADLLVGHDGAHLYLRSRRLGVRVRPTSRHMLNHHSAPPVVQFLDAVGQSLTAEFSGFDWGEAERLPVLPRVQVGRTVLAPARWLITLPGWSPPATVDPGTLADALETARSQWGLPDRVYATAADNRLLLDLSQAQDVEQLRREFRNSGGSMRLQEALPDVGDAWLPGPDGSYLTEIVVSLVRQPPREAGAGGGAQRKDVEATSGSLMPTPSEPVPGGPAAQEVESESGPVDAYADLSGSRVGVRDRVRLPGSDWLFAKFYAPFDELNRLLVSGLTDLIDMAENSGLVRRWFFLRYSDPEPHLRVRWQGDPDVLVRHLLPQVNAFAEQLLAGGRVTKLVVDTYDREVERYGGLAGLDLCESVFHVDSASVRRLLDLHGYQTTDVAVASTASLLAGLGLDAEHRIALYETQLALVEDPQVGRTAGEDYRTRKTSLRALLGPGPEQGPLSEALDGLRTSLEPLGNELRKAEASGSLEGPLEDLWPSLVHMHHNRLVGPVQAPAEPHMLHLLLRTERGLSVTP